MKRLLYLATVFGLILSLSLSATAALTFCAVGEEVVSIDAEEIEAQLSLKPGSLYGVTILSVPAPSDGLLYCEGIEVVPYDYLSREALSSCVFLPTGETSASHLALLPNAPGGSYTPVSLVWGEQSKAQLTATLPAAQYAWAVAHQRYYASVIDG